MKAVITVFTMLLVFLSGSAFAVIESYEFDNDLQRKRYQHFIEELRCPKCQNQNLSGSDSAIAKDLRQVVHSMLIVGKSDIEITQYMLDRYGDFILYQPRFTVATAVLWLAPALLLLIGVVIWWRLSRAKTTVVKTISKLTDTEQQQLQALLDGRDRGENGRD
ncbi:MAG: cytochrome c-type biogenesis protein [Spongiibacteraceae bacterium]